MRPQPITVLKAVLTAAVVLLATAASATETVRIPLVPGLVVASSTRWSFGDEEALTVISAADAQSVTYRVLVRVGDEGAKPARDFTRRVRREDLRDARRVIGLMQAGDAETFPGSTFDTLSAALLTSLNETGKADLAMGTITTAEYESSHAAERLLQFVPAGRRYFRGSIEKTATRALPVLVNGEMTPLPAIAVKGTLRVGADTVDIDHWVLNDLEHPLLLASNRGRVVRIDFPIAQPPLEAALSDGDCRATLTGIYFDTGSATLLAPSAAALDAAADVLRKHPAWTLTVEGHTDNVGSAASNQQLSERRAAAVQAALLQRSGVQAQQLQAAGFGATRPMADNSTLEGRAANRRVELSRACP